MDVFCYERYFNATYELEDFFEIVDSLVVDEKPERPKKKAKKSYALQIGELKQEIINLRQEIEIQNHQMLCLIALASKPK